MNKLLEKADWFVKHAFDKNATGDIRPYVFVRPENQIKNPGQLHELDWFGVEPILKNPLNLEEIHFAEMIYYIEGHAFGPANMAMPRWVFYDCAVIPGFVAGFAMKKSRLPAAVAAKFPPELLAKLKPDDWVPLSLFIIIPTMGAGEWVAHNLCAINSLLDEKDRFYGLGFLSKAFGLWYANVRLCCGMTQWGSPALKLHSHYGHLEIVTSYTPVHSHANTVTYRAEVNTSLWEKFFTRESDSEFDRNHLDTGLVIDPKNHDTMKELHYRIEKKEGPYYLSAQDISNKKLNESLKIFKRK